MEAILEGFASAQSKTGGTVGGNGFAYSMEAAASGLAFAFVISPDESLDMIYEKVRMEVVYVCKYMSI